MNLSSIPLAYILKAVSSVKKLAYLIAVIGACASYGTQVELLAHYGLGKFAWVIPATIDLLAICSAIGLNIPGIPEKDKTFVTRVLVTAVTVSVVANMAGGHNWVARIAHAWPVVAYLLAEGIVNRIRNYAAQVQAAQAQAQQDKAAAEAAAAAGPIHATATVQKPAPSKPGTPTAPPAIRPGSAKSQILALAAVKPPLPVDEIAKRVGTKPGWVKHVLKTPALTP
jgi:AcrR family transcriptional regulator